MEAVGNLRRFEMGIKTKKEGHYKAARSNSGWKNP
jgi:hypothetical protein